MFQRCKYEICRTRAVCIHCVSSFQNHTSKLSRFSSLFNCKMSPACGRTYLSPKIKLHVSFSMFQNWCTDRQGWTTCKTVAINFMRVDCSIFSTNVMCIRNSGLQGQFQPTVATASHYKSEHNILLELIFKTGVRIIHVC